MSENKRKRSGFDGVIHWLPGLFDNEQNYAKVSENIVDMISTQSTELNNILLKEKMFDFIGTDAHGIDRRPPILKEYIDFLYRNYDKDYVDGILYKNAMECFGLE